MRDVKLSRKTCLPGVFAFFLGFLACLVFMTADVPAELTAGTAEGNGISEEALTEKDIVIVIDPGHGGFDGGAKAADGTEEKNINLTIAEKLKEQASAYPVEIVMTRDGDYGLYAENSSTKKRDDLQNRKNVMEESGAALAVSIHLNSYPQNSSVYGAQVFYSPDNTEETALFSGQELAESVQKSLEINISDGRERTAMKKNDVLIMKNPPCPVILVECGFLSCPQEAEKLKTAEYQQVLASSVWQGLNEILCLEVKKSVPVIDSANK